MGHVPDVVREDGLADMSLRLEYRSPAELAENPGNWRRHPDTQIAALSDVITEVGWAGACLFNERTGRLIDGHARRKVALEQGCEKVPVLVGDWSEADEAKILATLDPLAAMAEADAAALDALLRDVKTGSQAVADMLTGLQAETPATPPVPGAGGDEFDATPEQGPTRTAVGDLWVIGGKHRLLVGDCTDARNVARLFGDERAGLMNTDPPYGVSYDNADRPNPGVAKPRVANDGLADEVLQEFLEKVFTAAVAHALKPNAAWYLWHAHLTQGYFAAAAAAAAANVVLHRQIIWVKPVLLLGRGQYHWKHEPCFMGWVKGNQPPDYGLGDGERTQTTVWEIGSVTQAERKEFGHATPKPTGLFTTPIVKHLQAGEIAYEPFAGSGPQFIAAHREGRRCFGMELDPRHCDTILKRAEAEGLTCEKAG